MKGENWVKPVFYLCVFIVHTRKFISMEIKAKLEAVSHLSALHSHGPCEGRFPFKMISETSGAVRREGGGGDNAL